MDEAEGTLRSTMKKVEAKYATKEWYKGSTALSYDGSGFWCSSGGQKHVSLYITVEGGDLISMAVDGRTILRASVVPDGQGKRIPWVYAHGKLEDDLKTDLFDVDLNGESVRDGLKALYHGKVVVFHLYRNMHGLLTGIATYADDKEAFAYGRELVATKPSIF